MSSKPRTAGFTLIELLVVVAIIGILAVIAIPQWQATKGKANTAALKSDLRNLVQAEEAYFYETATYTADLDQLWFRVSPNVNLTVVEASGAGWAATATHVVASPETCGIFYGNAAPPLGATTVEGIIACE